MIDDGDHRASCPDADLLDKAIEALKPFAWAIATADAEATAVGYEPKDGDHDIEGFLELRVEHLREALRVVTLHAVIT